MNEKHDCVSCEGIANLRAEERSITYKKEEFKVFSHFYKCDECGTEFTTDETDTLTLTQVYNQYRSKYNILFPDELTELREKFSLTASSMSTVLGLGVNGYANYEGGEMPTVALSNLIRSATKLEAFTELLVRTKDKVPQHQFERALHVIRQLKQLKRAPSENRLNFFYSHNINEYSGYKRPDYKVILNLIKLLLGECKSEFNDRLKINKMFFYIDFLHYKKTARSITGLPYRAIQYGPVPVCYDSIITKLVDDEIICQKWRIDARGAAREIFEVCNEADHSIFTKEEQLSIGTIVSKFKDISSWDIVELSHDEMGWINNELLRNKISYQNYAFLLKNA